MSFTPVSLKVSDACGLVLDDRPEVVTESMMLFLQGLGFCEFPHDKRLVAGFIITLYMHTAT